MSRLHKNRGKFTQAPNAIIQDSSLSFKARGLWVYLESKPDNWNFSLKRIASDSPDGIDSVRNGIKELEAVGLLRREKAYIDGKFDGYDYFIQLEKVPLEKSLSENPSLENPTTGNPTTYKEREKKKDLKIKKDVVVPPEKQQQQGFDLAGKEREEFKAKIENDKLLDIPTTKEYLLNEKDVWRLFRQWTNVTERLVFEKVLNEFLKVETGNEGILYPRPKGKSLFHFQNWTSKKLTSDKALFRIEEIKPVIQTPQLTEEQKAEQQRLGKAQMASYMEKLKAQKEASDKIDLEKRKTNESNLRTLSSNISSKSVSAYLLP